MSEADLTILVVDDEPIIRMTLADALEEAGYKVLEASNVLEAVATIGRVTDICAIVTDIDMPGGLSGIDLLQMVNNCQTQIPVIVTSGGHALDTLNLPENTRFFSKPYNLEDIVLALRATIAAKAKSRTNLGVRWSGLQFGQP